MAKKMNLATALHKGSGKRTKGESPSDTIEAIGTGLMTLAAREEASAAQAAKLKIIPAIGRAVSKAVYGTFYYASYGIMLTAVTVVHWIPSNNAMGRGVKDGAAAAEADFEQWQAQASRGPVQASTAEYPVTA